jgi:hypothetical protein
VAEVAEVHVALERAHHAVGDEVHGRDVLLLEADVESRAHVEGATAVALAAYLVGLFGHHAVASVFPLPIPSDIVQLALELAPAPLVGFMPDPPLELFLVAGLGDVGDVDRTRAVLGAVEAASTELELDEVVLHLDEGDHDPLPLTEGDAARADAVSHLAVVERVFPLGIDVDSTGGRRHVEAHDHGAAFEEALQCLLGLVVVGDDGCREHQGQGGEGSNSHGNLLWHRSRKVNRPSPGGEGRRRRPWGPSASSRR